MITWVSSICENSSSSTLKCIFLQVYNTPTKQSLNKQTNKEQKRKPELLGLSSSLPHTRTPALRLKHVSGKM